MKSLKALATGIGSLPVLDPQKAVELVMRYAPAIPFWPQLPKVSAQEGMLLQFSQNLPGLKIHGGDLRFAPADREHELELFYERFLAQDLEYFQVSPEFACGLYAFHQRLQEEKDLSGIEFIKLHVTGPFTFCSGVKDTEDKLIIHDKVLVQAMANGLCMKALWQLDVFKKFGKKMIVFFDEPALTGIGSAYSTLSRIDVIDTYLELKELLKPKGCLLGMHCCGNTDWSMLIDSGIDIINFDAFNFQDRFVLYAENLKTFLKKGGIICWGIVPTQEPGAQTPEMLEQKIRGGLDVLVKKGLDRRLLLERLLISPACGLGTLEEQKAEQILSLLDQTSQLLRKNL